MSVRLFFLVRNNDSLTKARETLFHPFKRGFFFVYLFGCSHLLYLVHGNPRMMMFDGDDDDDDENIH